jgi:hypothetical protein
LCSQKLATCLLSRATSNQSNSRCVLFFKINFIIILPSTTRSSKWPFPSRLPTRTCTQLPSRSSNPLGESTELNSSEHLRITSLNYWLTALFLKQTPLCEKQRELNGGACLLGISWNFIRKWLADGIEYRISTIHQEGHSLQWYGNNYFLVQNYLNRLPTYS